MGVNTSLTGVLDHLADYITFNMDRNVETGQGNRFYDQVGCIFPLYCSWRMHFVRA